MVRRSPTLAAVLEDWLTVRSAGRGLSPNTVRAYRADIATVAAELAGPADDGDDRSAAERVTVDQLRLDAVVHALAAVQRAGRSPATRARIHGTLAGCAHTSFTKGSSSGTRSSPPAWSDRSFRSPSPATSSATPRSPGS